MYQEYEQCHFLVDGYEGTVIYPKNPRGDRAYIWRTEFLGAFDYVDRELLKRGWHLVYYKVSDQFGAPSVLPSMRTFQRYIEEQFQLKEKAVLFGFSRGGSVCGELCCAISGKSLENLFGCAGIGCFQLAGRIRSW